MEEMMGEPTLGREARGISVGEMEWSGKLCLGFAKLFLNTPLKRFGFRNQTISERFKSSENYVQDRVSNIDDYYNLFSKFSRFEGKRVLELGCSTGYLLANFLKFENFQAIGADISETALTKGRSEYGDRIEFMQSTPTSIPLEDKSVDLIYTVDTVEHLSKPYQIFMDAYRVLKPGGLFIIHFHPWLGPYGSHLEDIIPFPWPHAIFSMDTLLSVAAELYNSDDYTPACYWIDETTGKRLPNPYLDREKWREFLNQMTIKRFKELLKTVPFEMIHYEKIGFGGKIFKLGQLSSGLAKVPVFDEFFTKAVFTVLRKPLTS
jgi:SAM-dependent methyltransferase